MSERENELGGVVLLSIDALRGDRLSFHGYDRETTPNLDRLASENLSFENAFSPSSHTREALAALLSGRYPDEAVDDGYELAVETLGTTLGNRGFTTGAFHSNPFVSQAYGYGAGFDRFDDDLHLGKHKLLALAQRALDKIRNRHYAPAEVINDRSLDWLDSIGSKKPFFLWNHYMDVHGPYEPPARYQRRFREKTVSTSQAGDLYKRALKNPNSISDGEHQALIDLYDAEVCRLDDQLGAMLDALDERGRLDDTLVIVTADHGDAFGEHGYYEHPRHLHDELVRVPLILSGPSTDPQRYTGAVSTLDIVPTVRDRIGEPTDGFPGTSLFEIARSPDRFRDRLVFSQSSGEGADRALRRFAVNGPNGERYAIERDIESATIENTATEGNNASERTITALRDHSYERLDAHGERRRSETEEGATDSEIEQRLRALGYRE